MTLRDWLALLGLSVLWGGSFFFIAVAVAEIPPLTLVVLRIGLAALILLAVLRIAGLALPRQPAVWLAFFGMGLLNNVIPFSLIAWAQSQIPSGVASILNATTPISTAVVAHVFTADEKLTPGRIAGVLLGLAGVTVMLGAEALSGLGGNLPAQGAVLLATVSYGFAAVFGRRFRRLGVAPLLTANGQLIAATLLLLPLALMIDQSWRLPLPSSTAIGAVLALAALSTALAYVIFFRVMGTAGSNVNLVTLLVPVSAVLFGVAILGETLAPRHLLGMAAIALGLAAIDGRAIRYFRRPRA